MDKRQIFMKLEEKYEELYASYTPLIEDAKAFEGDENFDAYNSFTEDEVKKEMYPEQYEMYQKIAELEPKIEAFERELTNAAREFAKQLNEEITAFENKIEVNRNHIQELEQEIETKKQKIAQLKESKEYKNRDEKTLLTVGDLESDVKAKSERKEESEGRMDTYEKELQAIRKEKEELLEDYPDIDEKIESAPVEKAEEGNEAREQSETETTVANNDEIKENVGEKPKSKNSDRIVATPGASAVNANTEEPKKENDEQEKKEPKVEFKELFSKAKKGDLDDKEFGRLVEIMGDTDNYSKYGITIGIMFNNGRKVFEMLNSKLPTNKQFLNQVKEKFGPKVLEGTEEKDIVAMIACLDKEGLTQDQRELCDIANKQLTVKEAHEKYLSAFFEKNKGKMPLISVMSKAFIIPEYEERKTAQALEEATSAEKKTTSSIQQALEEAVVPPGEEQEIKAVPNSEEKTIDNR